MTAENPDDVESLIEALRADVPDAAARERARTRLIAAGVAVTASMGSASGAAAAASAGAGAAMSVTKGAPLGAWAKLASLSFAQKLGLAAVIALVGTALPVTPKLLTDDEHPMRRAAAVSPAKLAVVVEKQATAAATRVLVQPEPKRVDVPAHAVKRVAIAGVTYPVAEQSSRPAVLPRKDLDSVVASTGTRTDPKPRVTMQTSPGASANASLTTHADADAAPRASAEIAPLSPVVATEQLVSAETTLKEETDLLERGLAALAARDFRSAQRWLELHAQRFPQGLLARERARAARRLAHARETTDARHRIQERTGP